jgi:outer membrane protein OmpA-like peptidoglycan-associated protein
LNQYSFDNSIIQLNQAIDPSFPNGTQRSMIPDISGGLLLQTTKLSIGLGGHQLLRTSLKEFNLTNTSDNRLARHYFLNASYKISVNEALSFIPAAMLKSTEATDFQTDVQFVAQFRNFLGLGLNYRFKESPAFIFHIQRSKIQLCYSYDMPGGALQNYQNGSHEIALGYTLRGKNDLTDADKDGVSDKKDKCPNIAGPSDNKGCPWSDSDQDGITDNIDKCPSIQGPIENSGCPWSDSDGDGLTDNADKCPFEKGAPENGGCPDKDSDGDGIVDRLDSCPMTNASNTPDGCPVLTEVQKKAIDQAITNLEFETGKAIILSSSYSALDMLAIMLNEKTDWDLAIEGHTDDVGDEAANLLLSQQRANAVATYLTNKGIAKERIDVKFFGEQKPIASNETEEGRKANRRVAMRFVFK